MIKMSQQQDSTRKGFEYTIDKSGIVTLVKPGEKYKINIFNT